MRASSAVAVLAGLVVLESCGAGGRRGGGGGAGTFPLTVKVDGPGAVDLDGGASAHCTGPCTVAVPAGAKVSATASPDPGATFVGWGGPCTGTSGCELTVTAGTELDATFGAPPPPPPPPAQVVLSVNVVGPGTVTSEPAGIDCGSACLARFAGGIAVTLHASPAGGSAVTSWSVGCGTASDCRVELAADTQVTVTFGSGPPPAAAASWEHRTKACVVFDGLADAAGNLYWLECSGVVETVGSTFDLVSFSPAGQQRFRVPVGLVIGAPMIQGDRLFLVEEALPSSSCAEARLTAISTADGSTAWSHDVLPDITPSRTFPNQCPAPLPMSPSAGPRQGTVILAASDFKSWDTVHSHDAALLTLDAGSGNVLSSIARQANGPGGADPLFLDEGGNLYFTSVPLGASTVSSLSPSGAPRWDVPADAADWVSATAGGLVVVSARAGPQLNLPVLRVRRASDGQVLSAAQSDGEPLVGRDGLTYRTSRYVAQYRTSWALVRFDPFSGTDTWVHFLDPPSEAPPAGGRQNVLAVTEVVRTAAETFAVVTQHYTANMGSQDPHRVYDPPVLREIDDQGKEIFSTLLGGTGAIAEHATVLDGRLTVPGFDPATGESFVRTYPFPGRTAAATGWAAVRGNMQRDQRAR